jgi:synaptic vesicle membrane protein VAT-1
VIDKSREDLWARAEEFAPHGFQAVLDANGPETLKHSFRHLAPAGRLVVYGFHTMLPHGGRPNPLRLLFQYLSTPRVSPHDLVDQNKSVLGFNLSYLFHELDLFERAMSDLFAKLQSGAIRPLSVAAVALDRAGEAHRQLQSGTTTGKLALIP